MLEAVGTWGYTQLSIIWSGIVGRSAIIRLLKEERDSIPDQT